MSAADVSRTNDTISPQSTPSRLTTAQHEKLVSRLSKTDKVQSDKTYLEGIVNEYDRFLGLYNTKCNTTKCLVPSQIVDRAWHEHILCTRDYASTCDRLFGRFLHHDPTEGTDGENEAAHATDYESTLALYKLTYGVEAPTVFWPAPGNCMNGCGGKCHSGDCVAN